MRPEEQLQVIEVLAQSISDSAPEVRRQAFACLVGFGMDGLDRIIDVIDNEKTSRDCRRDAVHALGGAFSEGKVDKAPMIKLAITALEECLANPDGELCEAAVDALGDIGPPAIAAKSKLLALLDGKKGQNKLCVKIAAALLKVSPVH
jgi:HEAT repeat protein